MRTLRLLTKTWKGRFVLLGLLFGVAMWLLGTLFGTGSAGRFSPETVRTIGAMALATMLLSTLLFGGTEGGVAFSPSEVEFLFPAPVPRRHLLVYRIVVMLLISFPTSVFIGCTLQRKHTNVPGSMAWRVVFLLTCLAVSNGVAVGHRDCSAGNCGA